MSQTAPPTLEEVRAAAQKAGYPSISLSPNGFARPEFAMTDEWRTWDASIETGRCVLAGRDVPMETYLRKFTTAMCVWQRLAYEYCMFHPTQALCVENNRKHWRICQRGDHVDLSLPYQDHGGDRSWSSRDGKTKVLVDVD